MKAEAQDCWSVSGCVAADALDGATRVVLPPEVLNGGKILLTESTLLISFFPSNVNMPM